MFFYEVDGEEFITLTYNDEMNLAKAVMDCIALRWVQGEFQTLLDRIHYIKCAHGSALKVEELDRLLYFMGERYVDELESLGIKVPQIEDNDQAIWSDLDESLFPTREERGVETRRMTMLAWRDVWNKHTAHKMAADKYKSFPGDDWRDNDGYDQAAMDAAQAKLEAAFWDEVNKTAKLYEDEEYDVPMHMIIKQVKDYMPRHLSDVDLE